MRIIFSAKNYEVSQRLRARIERKIDKLSRYFLQDVEARVRLSAEHVGLKGCEITIPFDSGVLRAEDYTDDMYQSVDLALAKIERQIHRHRTRLEKRLRVDAFKPEEGEFIDEYPAEEPEARYVSRTKQFPIKPMVIEDAIEQFDMLGHAFFVFVNSDTSQTCVLYKRKDGSIGMLEPEA
ncbi:MAG: ribosome-associated translation inhibitor RaiA [Oscillospiraceae bacterium]|jgi:putative sigma-54 modulation protein|nr:ribosome-associated translation inhibitor RaiA [Oscillospiraceae bacterium]